MQYREFVNAVKKYEDSSWFGEALYFMTLDRLRDIRMDLGALRSWHMQDVIRMFLIQWGGMRRTVGRKELDWNKLTSRLAESRDRLKKLQGKTLLDIDLTDPKMAEDIEELYEKARVAYIGPTAISKILHLLNPELFVMWDDSIRRSPRSKRARFPASSTGYVKFLRQEKRELEELIEDQARRKRTSKGEIARWLSQNLPSEKLGEKYRRKSLVKLLDEYNWITAH